MNVTFAFAVAAAVCLAAHGEPVHYRLTYEMNRTADISGRGLTAAISDVGSVLVTCYTEGWERKSYVFRVPDSSVNREARPIFGTYRTSAPIPYRNAEVERVLAVHARVDGLELGVGENITGNHYAYDMQSDGVQNSSRPLVDVRHTQWNTDRWCLNGKSSIAWRYVLPGREFTSADVRLYCRRWYGGRFSVEASADGSEWTPLGVMATNRFDAAVPSRMLPSGAVWVRLRGNGEKETRALLTGVSFDAQITGKRIFAMGATRYVLESEAGSASPPIAKLPWQYEEKGAVVDGASDGSMGVWTVSSGWKVPRFALPLPSAHTNGVVLRAARNEAESTQLVISPSVDAEDVFVAVEGLPPEIAADAWRVGYIQIDIPTDSICLRGPVADPLPPQTGNLSVGAGLNQPFWIRAKPAKGARAGLYRGRLVVSAKVGGKPVRRTIPFAVEVFDFDFPDAVTIRSLFNLGLRDVNKFHNAKTREDRERLEDIYLAAMDEYHLSPFRWTQYTKWGVKWDGAVPILETADFDKAMKRVKAKYHFNSFRVSGFNSPLCSNDFGLGKANAHETIPAELCGFRPGTAEYEERVAALLGKVQEHFRSQGYLEEAIFYCFDEPKSDAMALVQNGYARLRKYAPDFKSIITTPVSPALLGGPHIWCSSPSRVVSPLQRERMAAGDEFWSYVCMGPKAPWITLFPDHPGVEMRTWLWQSWAKGLTGVLIWTTTLWDGMGGRLPKGQMQNPYFDAMSYRVDARHYGNCDGRLFYPPFASVGFDDTHRTVPVPQKGAECDFSKPVSSVRLEMLKDGIEDYEYLVMLRRLDPRNPLLAVPEEIFRTLSDFNFDPTPMERRRVEVAREIVRLMELNHQSRKDRQ